MNYKFSFLAAATGLASLTLLLLSCEKDYVAPATPSTPAVSSASFVEQFDNVGDLSSKGWVFKNNSNPIGQNGWRQGRYEAASVMQFKFLAPEPFIGFPAYNASKSPNDFVSCDASCVNDANGIGGRGDISAWLISPSLPMKNGDKIIFYTRAINDANYPDYARDRMQVRANFLKGGTDVGSSPASTGNFDSLLLDINPAYIRNDPAGNTPAVPGYPRAWTRYTLTIANLPAAGVTNARFAFRYLGTDAGVFGGSTAANFPSVVGIDSLAFVHQ
ncbi:choice-of-anchor J domain-containing protein [Flavisolibacter ginsenosidimutans]|uniref:DUF5017 domain-containing protein n=1 Tax=Flavisolibacter ginsenosidimutans TaxID=661481 RepID=A0A5B8UH66_9BACT|nr:choice-of-anchor J domain-containing protein [Flavisolibacter ginsenosidimutans]QEC55752.1 hypothetical protein FSB75_07560 [Flavisolibacter ginsenosidimutans]